MKAGDKLYRIECGEVETVTFVNEYKSLGTTLWVLRAENGREFNISSKSGFKPTVREAWLAYQNDKRRYRDKLVAKRTELDHEIHAASVEIDRATVAMI